MTMSGWWPVGSENSSARVDAASTASRVPGLTAYRSTRKDGLAVHSTQLLCIQTHALLLTSSH